MASTINSDNGVASGSVGLKYASDNSGVLALQTNGNTAITITSTGNVGVGNTSPTSKLTVGGAIESLVDQQGGSAEGGQLVLRAPVGGTKRWNVDNYQNQLRFFNENDSDASSGSVALTVTANGILSLAGASTAATGTGITFPGSQSASTDPNTLDDYEEGTFTPTAANFTTTNYTMTGTYVKIGKLVWVSVVLTCTGTVGWSTSALIDLPFASSSGTSGNFIATRNTNSTSNISTNNNNFAYPDLANARVFLGSFSVAMGTGDKFTLTGTYLTTS